MPRRFRILPRLLATLMLATGSSGATPPPKPAATPAGQPGSTASAAPAATNPAAAVPSYPGQTEGDFIAKNFAVSTGQTPDLGKIKARVLAVNFADDELNPPDLGVMEREMARVKHGRFVTLPAVPGSRGHQSLAQAALWKRHVLELLGSPATAQN